MTQSPPMLRFSGNQLKRWRTKANVSREQLAAASNYSPDTIKAMEQGVRMPTPRVLDVADELCRAEGLLSAAKDYLSREKFPPRAQEFMEREREAIGRWSYDATYVPGLLQTRGLRSPLVDAEQLRRLLEVSLLRNVALQVLPFARAIPAALLGPMVPLETRDHERFAYAEGQLGSQLTADPDVVSRTIERLSMIRAEALSPAESARFIERMVDQP